MITLFRKKYKNISDEQLMEFIQRRDSSAFDELYRRYHTRLLFYFFKMFNRDEDKSQDFLQDIFLKIIEKPHLFVSKQRFSSWIFRVAHNMCKNEYRRLDVRKIVTNEVDPDTVPFDSETEMNATERAIDKNIFENRVTEELSNLNPEYKSTFILRYQEELSIKEIADILDCPLGTIKSRLFQINIKLMDRLKDFDPNRIEVK